MASLYVDRKGVSVRVDNGTLVFEEAGRRVGCVPLGPIDRVIFRGDVSLQASVLSKLGEQGVGVIVLTGRRASPSILMHRPHNDARRRLLQWQASSSADVRVRVARWLLQRKFEGQRQFLAERSELDLMHRFALKKACGRIESAERELEGAASIASLRGMEGAAAQAYFGGFQELFAPSLKFSGRTRRPPKDPVNAVLSLGYTLLHAEAVLQSYAAGLDPYVGFLHELDFGRESLACDLVEPLRAGVDRWVFGLFRQRLLEAHHFSHAQGACLLGKAGRTIFYRQWEPMVEGLRSALTQEARDLLTMLGADPLPEASPPEAGPEE